MTDRASALAGLLAGVRYLLYNWHMCSIELPQPNKQYKTDHSIVFSCQYHVIWCPKYRRKVLVPPIDQQLKELIQEKQAAYRYEVLAIEIMPNHVHLILDSDPRVGMRRVPIHEKQTP
jgi:putative transposase